MSVYLDTRGNSDLAIAICARCSRKFPRTHLRSDPNSPGLKVCSDDLDQLDPYRLPARQADRIALEWTRPDVSVAVIGNPPPTTTYASPGYGLINDNGFLCTAPGVTNFPTSPQNLLPGALWSNGGFINAVPGYRQNAPIFPVIFGAISAIGLQALGAAALPSTAPPAGSLQIWVANGQFVCVAIPYVPVAPVVPLNNILNDGGVAYVSTPANWPTSPKGLQPGAFYLNGTTVCIVMPVSPNPAALPVYFGAISAADLLALGGANIPTTVPPAGSLQFYNSGGQLCIA